MKVLGIIAAAIVSFVGSAPANAYVTQPTAPVALGLIGDVQLAQRWDDRRDDRRYGRGRYERRNWDRGRHRGWRNRDRWRTACHSQWRNGHRERVCRRIRYR